MGLETVEKDKGNLVDGQSEFHNKHDVPMIRKNIGQVGCSKWNIDKAGCRVS